MTRAQLEVEESNEEFLWWKPGVFYPNNSTRGIFYVEERLQLELNYKLMLVG